MFALLNKLSIWLVAAIQTLEYLEVPMAREFWVMIGQNPLFQVFVTTPNSTKTKLEIWVWHENDLSPPPSQTQCP